MYSKHNLYALLYMNKINKKLYNSHRKKSVKNYVPITKLIVCKLK